MDEIQSTLTSAFVEALFDGLLVILTLVLMFVYSPTLAWVAVIAVLLYLVMRLIWYRPLYAAFEETLVRDAIAVQPLSGVDPRHAGDPAVWPPEPAPGRLADPAGERHQRHA